MSGLYLYEHVVEQNRKTVSTEVDDLCGGLDVSGNFTEFSVDTLNCFLSILPDADAGLDVNYAIYVLIWNICSLETVVFKQGQ